MKKIISIIGARPQFIKHAPMQLELQKHFNALTLHTGQHFDSNMSAVFFDELNIPKPDFLLESAAGKPHGAQTGLMMIDIEQICLQEKPDALLLYGDTNSTLAGALVAAKMNIPQIHIEAGLRSYNREMPEEINRIISDEFAYLLFCPTDQAIHNLEKEGIKHDRIFKSGDVMCDILRLMESKIEPYNGAPYYFVTIHRPYNTDDLDRMRVILKTLNELDKKVIFSIHPRTLNILKANSFDLKSYSNIEFVPPTGYLDSISYQKNASCVITDSGGIQKEAYMLKKKCITIRKETEWVETLENGWNSLVFDDVTIIPEVLQRELEWHNPNLYGDGHAAKEIVEIIKKYI